MNVKQEPEWRKRFVLHAFVHNSKLKNARIGWFSNIGSQLMAYRTAIYESTGFSPFRVLFGRSPTLPVDLLVPLPSEAEHSYPRYVSNLKHIH